MLQGLKMLICFVDVSVVLLSSSAELGKKIKTFSIGSLEFFH